MEVTSVFFFCDQTFFSFSEALQTADGQRKRKEGPPDHGYISYGDRKMVLKATIPDRNRKNDGFPLC